MTLPLLPGRSNALTQRTLALLMGWTVRDVQQAIEEARQSGIGICSGPEGVWLPESSDDLAESNRRLRDRLRSQYRTLRQQQWAERRMREAEARVEALELPWTA